MGKQLSNGVTRFDVKWSVNWFVSLAVNIYFVTCHTFLLFYFSNLLWLCVSTVSSRSNATIGYLHLHKMPPLFCYYTWQPILPRQSGLSNNLDQPSETRSASHHPSNNGYKWGATLWFNQSLDYILTDEHSSFTIQYNPYLHIIHSIREESIMGDCSSRAKGKLIKQVGVSLHLFHQNMLH